jgi:hypothetical protein
MEMVWKELEGQLTSSPAYGSDGFGKFLMA